MSDEVYYIYVGNAKNLNGACGAMWASPPTQLSFMCKARADNIRPYNLTPEKISKNCPISKIGHVSINERSNTT